MRRMLMRLAPLALLGALALGGAWAATRMGGAAGFASPEHRLQLLRRVALELPHSELCMFHTGGPCDCVQREVAEEVAR